MLAESRREFFAGRELDIVLDPGIVGNDDAALCGVAKQTDDGGMCPADNADDATFGAAGAGNSAETNKAGDDGVAMHSVFDVVARDKDVAVDVGQGDIRDDKTVAVLMKDETAFDFVAGNGLVLRKFACDLCVSAIGIV